MMLEQDASNGLFRRKQLQAIEALLPPACLRVVAQGVKRRALQQLEAVCKQVRGPWVGGMSACVCTCAAVLYAPHVGVLASGAPPRPLGLPTPASHDLMSTVTTRVLGIDAGSWSRPCAVLPPVRAPVWLVSLQCQRRGLHEALC